MDVFFLDHNGNLLTPDIEVHGSSRNVVLPIESSRVEGFSIKLSEDSERLIISVELEDPV